MTTKTYDAIVIGGGPGGYVAGIRLAQLKQSTLVIEKESWGGVCLNWGCIPSKALIAAANFAERARTQSSVMGVNVGPVSVDSAKMQEWKNGIVKKLTTGVQGLLKGNGAEMVKGTARLLDAKTVEVTAADGSVQTFSASKAVVVSTGAQVIELPTIKLDGKKVISAKEGVSLSPLPKRLTIIGGGIIGMELGGVYSKLGVAVTIVEFMPAVLASMDADLAAPAVKHMEKAGVKFLTSAKATGYVENADGSLTLSLDVKGEVKTVDTDVILLAVGFRPNSADLGLEKLGVALDKRGHVLIDERCETNVKGVYAIGDVAGGPYLAHKASKEGEIAAEVIAGHHSARDWRAIAAATFTHPEIASVGLFEHEAKAKGIEYTVGKFPFAASGRAMAVMETDGFVKVIAEKTGPDKKDAKIIGVHIVGPEASDLISEAALAVEMDAFVEDLGLTIHPHPTLSETLMEAAKAAIGEAVHVLNR
jgi:dihydrolipoamide dehydrogenase